MIGLHRFALAILRPHGAPEGVRASVGFPVMIGRDFSAFVIRRPHCAPAGFVTVPDSPS